MNSARAAGIVGVLGGTFDPVHLGHLQVADRVRRVMDLPRVLLLPTAMPPHKSAQDLAPAHHRAEMLRLALEGWSGLELCTLELSPDRVCFTIDTLRAMRRGPPACEPMFCVGTDALLQIHTWRDWRDLLDEFDLIGIDRAGLTLDREMGRLAPAVAARISRVPDVAGAGADLLRHPSPGRRIFYVAMAPIPISSSDIRARAAAGLSLASLVPPAVAAYIQEAGLYRQEDHR